MPHISDHQVFTLQPPPPSSTLLSKLKKPFKISRSPHKLLRFVFKPNNIKSSRSSSSVSEVPTQKTKDRYYVVYDKRNKKKFENEVIRVEGLWAKVERSMEEIQSAVLNDDLNRTMPSLTWEKPEYPCVKLNVDAAASKEGGGTLGGVIRDAEGCCLGAFMGSVPCPNDPVILEAMAVRKGLEVALKADGLVPAEEDDLAGLGDVSSDGDDNSEVELTDGDANSTGIISRSPYKKRARAADSSEPLPLMEGEGKSFRVCGFNQSQRAAFVQILMSWFLTLAGLNGLASVIQIVRFLCIIYGIWKYRNTCVIEGRTPNFFNFHKDLGSKIDCCLKAFISSPSCKDKVGKHVRWNKPLPGMVKFNSDGSSLGNPGPAGVGGLFRDEEGR
ncbi:CHD3-type chromatin-remodeling factor PICKLE isoform X1 [Senna tora]|uniref:CHD3-type chromatin-remodeling factor PICKLE isoform X1 n=1 Tax=Senna tora TaxID=362788 RepID=A0A834TEB4_9FABA|nr:CHD3-type chromatin-remodeling factor PICKLE isoform X1 [Senna tora]